MINSKDIGGSLRKARNLVNMEVKEVSDFLVNFGYKASINTIYSWENGNSQPTPEIFLLLCKHYKIDDVLSFFGACEKPTISKTEIVIQDDTIKKYHRLNDDGKERVGEYIDGLMPKYEKKGEKLPEKIKAEISEELNASFEKMMLRPTPVIPKLLKGVGKDKSKDCG